jgi:valyl-tRNA synthetase
VESTKWIEAQVYAGELKSAITAYSEVIQTLARARPVTFLDSREALRGKDIVALVLKESEVVIPMASMVDLEAERKRLEKEIEETQNEVARLEARLKDKAFLSKAPPAVVDKERQKLATGKDKLKRLKQSLNKLG